MAEFERTNTQSAKKLEFSSRCLSLGFAINMIATVPVAKLQWLKIKLQQRLLYLPAQSRNEKQNKTKPLFFFTTLVSLHEYQNVSINRGGGVS